jgi:DNA-binding transcriptional MerR regulator
MPVHPRPSAGQHDPDTLVPIEQAARRFGVRASALRYYEERGLLAPASRHSGRRWYGPAELRRIAVIRYWQRSALLSLEEIAELLDGPDQAGPAARPWPHVARDRIAAMRARISALEQACALLEHTLEHHPDGSPEGCPYYEEELWADGSDADRSAVELPPAVPPALSSSRAVG